MGLVSPVYGLYGPWDFSWSSLQSHFTVHDLTLFYKICIRSGAFIIPFSPPRVCVCVCTCMCVWVYEFVSVSVFVYGVG